MRETAGLAKRSGSRRMPAGAFTLLELLVVVAVITVLAAILLPSLSRSREQAKRVVCLSNTHQMAVGLHVYTVETKYYPGHHLATGRYDVLWPVRLKRYLQRQHQTFWCPTAPRDTYWNGTARIVPYLRSAIRGEFGTFGYGYNDWGVREFTNPHLGLGGHINDPVHGEPRAERIRQPSQMIAIADNESDGVWDTAIDPYEQGEAPGDRHRKGANVVFCDGHAEWFLRSRLTARRLSIRRMWNNDFRPHRELWGDGG